MFPVPNNYIVNIIMAGDSYKLTMPPQYPEGTQYVASYVEARGEDTEIVVLGLQAQLDVWESNPITMEMIEEAASYLDQHGISWNRECWEYIVNAHEGRLPIRVDAVHEGTVVKGDNVVARVINTDPRCYWLTTHVETTLLRSLWYSSSVATLSRECKKIIKHYMQVTGADMSGLDFKLHDFGARGATSAESAALAGTAHLVNFQGTDTLEALIHARKVYKCPIAGFSIDAAEHSTITTWGREGEFAAYRNMIKQFGKPGKFFAVVSDSFDLMNAVTNGWGGELKDEVIKCGGTLVVRPDSGNPVHIVRDTILALMDVFGCEFNEAGFKVLPSCVRVIQGDGINIHSLEEILKEMVKHRLSVDNIAFGMGGGLHQMVNRDTHRWAMKCSAVCINGVWYDVQKDPKTDPTKRSKTGIQALIKVDGQFLTVRQDALNGRLDYLGRVFEDGKVIYRCNFVQVRQAAAL